MAEDLLIKGASELGIQLSPGEVEKFRRYTELLLEWNQKLNLTAITDPSEIAVKHHLDSLTCFFAARIPKGARIADVGTGAGFPGMPLAIIRPDLRIVLMDATKKKLSFLEIVRDQLELANVQLVQGRAEELGRMREQRESYDVVVARAVAEMRVLAEYCLPLVRVGGVFIAMKTPDVDDELARAKPGLGTLGGARPEVHRLTLPGSDIGRALVVIKKIKPTPDQFPRHGSQIAKKPL